MLVSSLLFYPIYTGKYNGIIIEDILPGIFIYTVTGNKQTFTEAVDELCTQLPDSDIVLSAEEELRKGCDEIFEKYSKDFKHYIDTETMSNLVEMFKTLDSVTVEVLDSCQLLVEVLYEYNKAETNNTN